ncbi:MAG: TIGR02281 family clan AA aspartic protease [Pseudomonadota bacterium]
MVGRFLFVAFAVIGFALIAVPREGASIHTISDGGDGWRPRAGAKPASASKSGSKPANAAWNGGDHALTRRADGHFYAPTTVNGMRVQMLVDTGASVVALTGADARAAGVFWDESDVMPVGRGASGDVYGVPVRLREIAIGGMTQRNVEAIVVPQGLDVSLLGQSYLSRLRSVEINGDTMQLRSQ